MSGLASTYSTGRCSNCYRLTKSLGAPLAIIRIVLALEWRNWQTHGTQNPATFTGHVGSTPTSSTNNPFWACLPYGSRVRQVGNFGCRLLYGLVTNPSEFDLLQVTGITFAIASLAMAAGFGTILGAWVVCDETRLGFEVTLWIKTLGN